jgi:hypothetical protein
MTGGSEGHADHIKGHTPTSQRGSCRELGELLAAPRLKCLLTFRAAKSAHEVDDEAD